jgi:hypothetical protein
MLPECPYATLLSLRLKSCARSRTVFPSKWKSHAKKWHRDYPMCLPCLRELLLIMGNCCPRELARLLHEQDSSCC